MPLDVQHARDLASSFDFQSLFIEVLGWSYPPALREVTFELDGHTYTRRIVAELGGAVALEVASTDGAVPDAHARLRIYREIERQYHENLLIFVDGGRTQALWYWVKRDGNRTLPREHLYVRDQPGDLFLSKVASMAVDLADLEDGAPSVLEVAERIRQALDVEPVTRRFYNEFQTQHVEFLSLIEGIDSEPDRRWYASVILNRLMFIYFLQRKGFLDNENRRYLQEKLEQSRRRGPDRFYSEFLSALFFEGFAKPPERRSSEARQLIGNVRYLNGGLFLKHKIELQYPNIAIPDRAFENVLKLFGKYSWNLNDAPGGEDNELNPDVLGYIFEKYINQKSYGAYYTRPTITEYLCEHTIHKLILDRINTPGIPGIVPPRQFTSVNEMLMKLDSDLCRRLLDLLPKLSLLDPACGSGAFLVAAMKTLVNIYAAVFGRIMFLNDTNLTATLRRIEREHPSVQYYIKKSIITENLYGVDLMEEATEIAKLRLFLTLVSSVNRAEDLEPLPNIDFNIMAGNSLIGLLKVEEQRSNLFWGAGEYARILGQKNKLVRTYKDTASYAEDLQSLRENIDSVKAEAREKLNDILLQDFFDLGIKYEQATARGKAERRPLTVADIARLEPFHWGYEFDQILQGRGGFDAIITNPPWEIFKPQAKEFFMTYSDLVTKKKMDIKAFESHQAELLKDPEIAAAWLDYLSYFPHQSAFFRSSPQYANQISVVNGKRAGTDINLYKLFLEQCANLLRDGGQCGIVIPSGIYTDLGTKQLREMLFTQTAITGLFGFENRREIFEGVHRSFKFVVLTFEKGSETVSFPAAFMRHDVEELTRFPQTGAIEIPVETVRRLSPDSLSVMEFRGETDVRIAEKMLRFPLLGERIEGKWNLKLNREFDMTNDSHLFRQQPGPGRLPLYEGKMIHQFTNGWGKPRYWVDEAEGRKALLGRTPDTGQTLDYQRYRLGFRDIASNTNERSLISSVIPPAFHGNKIPTVRPFDDNGRQLIGDITQLFLSAIWNSFVVDWLLRMKITTTLNFFYIYQLPVPRYGPGDPYFGEIVERAARLICTTPEYDDLAREVIGDSARSYIRKDAGQARGPAPTEVEAYQEAGGDGVGAAPRGRPAGAGDESSGYRETVSGAAHKPNATDATDGNTTSAYRGTARGALGDTINDTTFGVTDPRERARLRAELDGMVAHIYGLTEEEFAHVLATFPLVEQSVKDAALEAYRALAPKAEAEDSEIAALLERPEGDTLEFKSSLRWDVRRGNVNKDLEKEVVGAVVAFLNARGGTLLIGIDDDAKVLGLERDYNTFGKKSWDGFLLHMINLLYQTYGGRDLSQFISITRHSVGGKDVCRVEVQPSPEPVWVNLRGRDAELWIRVEASSQPLSARETHAYISRHWPPGAEGVELVTPEESAE